MSSVKSGLEGKSHDFLKDGENMTFVFHEYS